MKRVTGLGGFFFKAEDPQKLKTWYRDHLGFTVTDWGATFIWGDTDKDKKTLSRTEWSPFKADTTYFNPSDQPYMLNYRVHDLEKLLEELRKENVEILGDIESYPYGKFGRILDPENRKIELWEPVDDQFGDAPIAWNEKVTGLGGIFFKSADPEKLTEWYKQHLGIEGAFRWNDLNTPDAKVAAHTIWAPFKNDTEYFSPCTKSFMVNYRVKNLDALLQTLRQQNVEQIGIVDEYPYGKFAWIMDPEGNKIELWEPKDDGF